MFARLVVLIAILGVVAGFMAPMNRQGDFQMLFNFGKKPAATSAPAATTKATSTKAPVKPVSAPAKPAPAAKAAPAKPVAAVKPAASKPVAPVKPVAAPAKPAAVSKPAPALKAVPKPAPKPASKPAPKKSTPVSSSGFLNGLVGSDVEARDFDPFQLAAGQTDETISWYRAAELKHGRIAMLAALGLSVQPVFHLPDPVFDSTLGYGEVTKLYQERPEAVWQILLALAAIETISLFKNGQGVAGNLGFDPLDLQNKLGYNSDPSKFSKVQLQELKHGRLAMFGSSALLLQEYATGYGPYEQLLPH